MTPSNVGPADIRELIERLRVRAHRSSRARYLAARRWRRIHLGLGLPSTAIAATVTTLLFSSLGEAPSEAISVGASFLAALGTVLAALQVFLDPGNRGSTYRQSGSRFNSIKRELDLLAVEARSSKANSATLSAAYRDLSQQFGEEEEASLDVPDSLYDRARQEQETDAEGI